MTFESRHLCALTLAVAAVLLALRPRTSIARAAWIGLITLGAAHAIALNVRRDAQGAMNVVHHYLGAKYALGYDDFYRAVQAARAEPPIGIRDLARPAEFELQDPRAQRWYWIELLRSEGATFDASLPAERLAAIAAETGALTRASRRELADRLGQERAAEFREDVGLALGKRDGEGRDITLDYGFNGSPLYASLRKLDPTLHFGYGPWVRWVHAAWQLAALALVVGLVGAALGMSLDERLAAGALWLASWDAVGWAMSGLVCAGLWLPIALALHAQSRGRPWLAGAAIAWAAGVKLFPVVLLLPYVAELLRAAARRRASDKALDASKALAGFALGVAAVLVIGELSGRSWIEFGRKIAAQFQSPLHMPNSVSVSQLLAALGVHESPLELAIAALAGLGLLAMFRDGDEASNARRALIAVAALGWTVKSWLNYYALAPLLLAPLVARTRPRATAVAVLALAAACAAPEFGELSMSTSPLAAAAKVLPYLAVPAWFVALEWSSRTRRIAAVALAVVLAAAGYEAWRWSEIRGAAKAGDIALASGEAKSACEAYERVVELAPRDPLARARLGVAYQRDGRDEFAHEQFTRAIELDPEHAPTRTRFGALLAKRGEAAAAEGQFHAALALAPWDDDAAVMLARVLIAQKRTDDARKWLARAADISPGRRDVAELLSSLP